MANYTITIQDGEKELKLVLRRPGFAELSMAYNTMIAGYAKFKMPDVANAGKMLIDTCAIEKESSKEFWDENRAELMMSAAIKASEIVEVFEASLKKN